MVPAGPPTNDGHLIRPIVNHDEEQAGFIDAHAAINAPLKPGGNSGGSRWHGDARVHQDVTLGPVGGGV
jgi:hypothetical protein